MADDDLDPVDRAALQRAVEMAKRQDAGRRQQVDSMLEDRDWLDVAQFCSYSCQRRNLKLKPWQFPPCWVEVDSREREPGDLTGIRAAAELLRRLLDAGLSQYEPDPVGALERIERQGAST